MQTTCTFKAYCDDILFVEAIIPTVIIRQKDEIPDYGFYSMPAVYQKHKIWDTDYYIEVIPERIPLSCAQNIVNCTGKLLINITCKNLFIKFIPEETKVLKDHKNGLVDMYFKAHTKDFYFNKPE